jgi:hypothetical protein
MKVQVDRKSKREKGRKRRKGRSDIERQRKRYSERV